MGVLKVVSPMLKNGSCFLKYINEDIFCNSTGSELPYISVVIGGEQEAILVVIGH